MTLIQHVLVLSLAAALTALSVQAAEPAYCNPSVFLKKEINPGVASGLRRAHSFQLGQVKLTGLGVGGSDASAVRELGRLSGVSESEKFCTWYFNKGNSEAEQSFWWIYLDNPTGLSTTSGPKEYLDRMGKYFDETPVSFLSCAENFHAVAMGCDGQKHRGPTMVAMLLSFSGCTADHSTTIVNGLWGLNGVSPDVRLAIAQAGFDLGTKHPDSRIRFQQLFDAR